MRLSGFVIAVLSFELACACGNDRTRPKRKRDQYIFVVLGMFAKTCFVICVFILNLNVCSSLGLCCFVKNKWSLRMDIL